jgi:hypothetical protein
VRGTERARRVCSRQETVVRASSSVAVAAVGYAEISVRKKSTTSRRYLVPSPSSSMRLGPIRLAAAPVQTDSLFGRRTRPRSVLRCRARANHPHLGSARVPPSELVLPWLAVGGVVSSFKVVGCLLLVLSLSSPCQGGVVVVVSSAS